MCVCIRFATPKNKIELSILTLSTQRQTELPQGKGSLPPTLDASSKPRLLSVHLTNQLQMGGRFQRFPSLGSINLLEWLRELRKTCFLSRLLIYYKENKSIARRRDTQGKVPNKGASVLEDLGAQTGGMLEACWFSSVEASKSIPCFFFFFFFCILWRLHHVRMID